jgi:hypothetical protein
MVSLLRPGAAILTSDPNGDMFMMKKGTFTCFVRKPGVGSTLYAVTAKHVFPLGHKCTICGIDPETTKMGDLDIGDSPTHIANFDFLYFEIYTSIRQQLTAHNFIPVGHAVEPSQVWNPGKLVKKVEEAPTHDEATKLQLKMMPVQFAGAVQASKGYDVTKGSLQKYSPEGIANINETTLAAGDSGGCVFDDSKLRYVGFISRGQGQQSAKGGIVLLLHDRLMQAGLVLATWADRGHWQ